jgi:hypothetical protein
MHGAIENVLHALELTQSGSTSIDHELNALATKVGLDMGSLGESYQGIGHKARYPVEVVTPGPAAELIDDAEAIRHYPEILEGFQLQGLPEHLWRAPTEKLSMSSISERLNQLLNDSAQFLLTTALPRI